MLLHLKDLFLFSETESLNSAELLNVANENNKDDVDEWCQRKLSLIPVSVVGGIATMVNMQSFINNNLGDDNFTILALITK